MNFLKKKAYLLIKMPKIFKEKVQFIKINFKSNKNGIHNQMKEIIF